MQIPNLTGASFCLRCADSAVLVGLVLNRRRTAAGLSMREVAARFGNTSPNTYACYEAGTCMPSAAQLDHLQSTIESELAMAE